VVPRGFRFIDGSASVTRGCHLSRLTVGTTHWIGDPRRPYSSSPASFSRPASPSCRLSSRAASGGGRKMITGCRSRGRVDPTARVNILPAPRGAGSRRVRANRSGVAPLDVFSRSRFGLNQSKSWLEWSWVLKRSIYRCGAIEIGGSRTIV
jgi:hypothetical protein